MQITNKTVSQNSRCYQHTGILRTIDTYVPTCSQSLDSFPKQQKQGKLTIPLYKTTKQSPSLKQKTSSDEFTVHSLLYAVQVQKHLLTGMQMFWNEQVSIVLQEPFDKSSSQTKAALAKRQIDKEDPNCKTRSIAQNTQNCLCFICLFRFVCFVSFKIKIPHDCTPHSCNMTASKY